MTLPLSLTVVAAEQSLVELEAKAATLRGGSRLGFLLGRTIVGRKRAEARSKVLGQEVVQLLEATVQPVHGSSRQTTQLAANTRRENAVQIEATATVQF